uniref:ATP-dependent DNA helicase n=1 Tax=Tanacetum cinerariifolium TaxID=118510 RepID=A0A6L2M7D0_TANCI|nr:uncharacterized protein [Tanacetum cinerariifolium]
MYDVDDDVPLAPIKRSKKHHIKISARNRLFRVFDEEEYEDLDEEDSDLDEEDSDQEEDIDEEDDDQEDSDDGWDGNTNRELNDGYGPYAFRLNGHNHHRIGTLLPTHQDGRPRMAIDRFRESSIQPVTLRLIGDGNTTDSRDVIVEKHGNEHRRNPMKRISELHPSFMALQYPLLFPYSEDGFHLHVPLNVPPTTRRKYVILLEYYYFHLQNQNSKGKTLHKAGRLFHTYYVDAYTDVLDHDQDWYKRNQNTIRANLYNVFHDHVAIRETNTEFLGRKFIFPSTFTGGPRHMIQQYQDEMAICRWAGTPDLFVTMTCNPRWPEIQRDVENYIPGQPTCDRPDTIAHVDEPIGFKVVRTHMMHGLCGDLYSYLNKGPDRATVVIEGQINKNNAMSTTTTTNTTSTNTTTTDNNSNTTTNNNNNNNTSTDNNNNNPRTPYQAILQHQDEIEEYLSCRYISASEACWKLLGYEMHYRSIIIERLPFHEEGCNRVYFRVDEDVDDVLERETTGMSKFTAWMKANEIYPHARTLREIFPYIYEDVARNQRMLLHNEAVVFIDEEILNYTLLELKTIFNSNNKSLLDFLDLLQIEYTLLNIGRSRLIVAERMYNANEEQTHFTNLYVRLNQQQRDVYDNIIQAVDERRIVLSVSSSGIASLLLPGGRTAHSRKVVVLGGDFQKIIPVIPNAPRIVVVASAINKSLSILDNCKVFVLSINMRLRDPTIDVAHADEMMHFHNWLMSMGDGRLSCISLDDEDEATWITIPNDLLIRLVDNHIEAIMSNTYPDLPNRIQDIKYLKERCILNATNDVVDKINSHVLDSMSGEMHELFSADKICSTSYNL